MAQIANVTRGTVLARDARHASSLWARLVGLMGRRSLPEGQALIFDGTRGVHTHFMRFSIDLLFYDREQRAVQVIHALPPWRFSPYLRRDAGVIELPAGAIQRAATVPGDQLRLP